MPPDIEDGRPGERAATSRNDNQDSRYSPSSLSPPSVSPTSATAVFPEEEWPDMLHCAPCGRWWEPYWFQSAVCRCGLVGVDSVPKAEVAPDPDDDRPQLYRDFFPLRTATDPDQRTAFDREFFPLRKTMPRRTLTPGTALPPRLLLARLDGIVKHLEGHTEGSRNHALHWSACRFGEMLAAGELNDPQAAADTLTSVALAIGLDPREINGTIVSGFKSSGVVV